MSQKIRKSENKICGHLTVNQHLTFLKTLYLLLEHSKFQSSKHIFRYIPIHSDFALDAILLQEGYPVAFESRVLNCANKINTTTVKKVVGNGSFVKSMMLLPRRYKLHSYNIS
jgi:hypothetical protein